MWIESIESYLFIHFKMKENTMGLSICYRLHVLFCNHWLIVEQLVFPAKQKPVSWSKTKADWLNVGLRFYGIFCNYVNLLCKWTKFKSLNAIKMNTELNGTIGFHLFTALININ